MQLLRADIDCYMEIQWSVLRDAQNWESENSGLNSAT